MYTSFTLCGTRHSNLLSVAECDRNAMNVMARGIKTGGGSRAGKKNKYPKAFRDRLRAYCEHLGVDPHEFMAQLLANNEVITLGVDEHGTPMAQPAVPIAIKFQAAKELASYLEPKLRSVELTGDPDRPLNHVVDVKTTLREALDKAYAASERHTNGHTMSSRAARLE
jgi:hypothetical protein